VDTSSRAPPSERREVGHARQDQQSQVSTILIDAGVGFVKRNPVKMLLWLVGLVLLQFATGFAASESVTAEYEAAMDRMEDTSTLERQAAESAQLYQRSKSFFSCTGQCVKHKEKYEKHQLALTQANQRNNAVVSDAKSKVGIMSEYGVSEARNLFWNCFNGGKKFAKRSSWYDMLFMGIGSMVMGRDESIVEFALRWGFQVLMNFTIGLCGALVGFYWYLWGLVTSYQADWFSGAAFFAMCVLAGTSLVATYLFALYGAAAGTVYVVAKAAHNARIEGGSARRPQYIRGEHGRQRPHFA